MTWQHEAIAHLEDVVQLLQKNMKTETNKALIEDAQALKLDILERFPVENYGVVE
jgi:hypothetical protein